VLDTVNDVRTRHGLDFQVGVTSQVLDMLRAIAVMASKERPEAPLDWVRDAHEAYCKENTDGFLREARWPLALWVRSPGKWLVEKPGAPVAERLTQAELDAELEAAKRRFQELMRVGGEESRAEFEALRERMKVPRAPRSGPRKPRRGDGNARGSDWEGAR
jgi:hypothetical protein